VAIKLGSGSSAGYFGLASGTASNLSTVAVVGVVNGEVVAGKNIKNTVNVEPVPTDNAYPKGWVYLIANVNLTGTSASVMQVYVDRTDVIAANVSVPNVGQYTGALIETTAGGVFYTDIIVSTYQLGITTPGYNNMDGYGQGSALLVNQLLAYYNLTAQMTLQSWSVPQSNILSFQINAMNSTGTKESTCAGFFQLGVDLNANGTIAPWYVPGINCKPYYSWPTQSGGPGRKGISSPQGTKLTLSIVWDSGLQSLTFKIVDDSTSSVFETTIPYYGGAFYSTYTQIEFQPCCANFPISSYMLDGSIYHMQITTVKASSIQQLSSSYMLPFSLDTPPSWTLTYYQDSIAGYVQTG